MAHKKAATISNNIVEFHNDLTELLKKYNANPDDSKIQLTTSDLTFRVGDISNCTPECIMRTPVKHPNGTTTIDTWCGC